MASPKAPTVGSAGNKKIGSSVRDKNNTQSDWREDFFITEETEIIGNDERARTELYLYSLCRARRRKTIVKINGKGYVFRIK